MSVKIVLPYWSMTNHTMNPLTRMKKFLVSQEIFATHELFTTNLLFLVRCDTLPSLFRFRVTFESRLLPVSLSVSGSLQYGKVSENFKKQTHVLFHQVCISLAFPQLSQKCLFLESCTPLFLRLRHSLSFFCLSGKKKVIFT